MRRVFIVRKDLHMSDGKLMAQIGHCVEIPYIQMLQRGIASHTSKRTQFAFELPREVVLEYIYGSIVKTVCRAKNKNHLLKAGEIARELGLTEGEDYGFVYDKCLTELQPEEEDGTCLTCFWTAPLQDDVAQKISRKYYLY